MWLICFEELNGSFIFFLYIMTKSTGYELDYCEVPEMSVQIWYLEWDWNSTKHWITLRAEAQPFNIGHIAPDGSEISFVVNGEWEMSELVKAFCLAWWGTIDKRKTEVKNDPTYKMFRSIEYSMDNLPKDLQIAILKNVIERVSDIFWECPF